ncbi:helix-turn-helix domain containing protein [Frigidibacter sp. RF13]|uniref:TetR/AcrR family transcriptional regulator n=1 Tax=Frigidibacter sp. RF13 TaxID=2997340 RepID=UPI0022718BE8|nr:TetR/AcrR family transcriptional regulator [Frigidibacter sp. RF13]MCY1126840.1 helix-turn-helix domain containing protein [Frigidibacter sp. RF13]
MRANAHILYSPSEVVLETLVKPRKKPAQDRSRATFEAILEAATRILREDGLGAMNTNRVAERAGVSVGSLYQYFPSREAILAELVRRMRLTMSARMAEVGAAVRHLPLKEAIPRQMAEAVRQYETEPRLTAALEEAEAQLPRDPEVREGRRRVREAMVSCLAGRGYVDPAEAAADSIAITRGIVMAACAAGRPDFDAIKRRITRAVLGYLKECPRVGGDAGEPDKS